MQVTMDVFNILQQMISGNREKRAQLRAMQAALVSVMEAGAGDPDDHLDTRDTQTDYHGMYSTLYGGTLQQVASRLHAMQMPYSTGDDPIKTTGSIHGSTKGKPTIDTSGLSVDQQIVVARVVGGVDDGKQTLTMLHGPGGTGKSFVVRRITEEIEKRNRSVVATCPTGAGACQLDKGVTFHSALKCSRSNHITAQSKELLKATFNSRVALVVVDEASMFTAALLVLLDERLRLLYNPNKCFGGMSILLVGDFAQLPVIAGVSLCKIMYCDSLEGSLVGAKNLFKQFKTVFLKHQERARDCLHQQRLLDEMRRLPARYPAGNKWTKADTVAFKPLTQTIVNAITRPLTAQDVQRDPMWLEGSVVLVTSNHDRAAMNTAMAKILARKTGILLFRWRKTLLDDAILRLGSAVELLYDESERPSLFAYFFKGAKGQVLDNVNGNVSWGLANGSLCKYDSLAWNDDDKTQIVLELTVAALLQKSSVVDLPFPPDFINVVLLDRDGSPVSSDKWPASENLYDHQVHCRGAPVGQSLVIVPIGKIVRRGDVYKIRIPATRDSDEIVVYFEQHAVDLAMAMTIWKAQGATFDRVILHHEMSVLSPPWTFECVYVALSRVRAANHLRCVPLSFTFDKTKLLNLRPKIFPVKWWKDLNRDGYWVER